MKTSFAVSLQNQIWSYCFWRIFYSIISKLKELGYQGVELAVRNPRDINEEEIKEIVKIINWLFRLLEQDRRS